jgi:hypothetical protein
MMKDDRHAVLLARLRDRACDAATPLADRVAVRGALRKLNVATQTLRGRPLAENLDGERSNCDPQRERAEGRAACDRPAQAGEGKENGAAREQRLNRQSKP